MSVTGVPAGLRDPAVRFIPLYPGGRASLWSGDKWQAGVPWDEVVDAFLRGCSPVPWENETSERGGASISGDLGVRLDPSGLVMFDPDVKRVKDAVWPPVVGRHQFASEFSWALFNDGRSELMEWLAERGLKLSETLWLESGGRTDGSRGMAPGERGWHVYYWQNPRFPIRQNLNLTANVEVKVKGYGRLTRDMAVMRDAPVVVLPDAVAEAISTFTYVPEGTGTPPGSGSGGGWVNPEQGYNSALTCLKGWLMERGHWWDEDAANLVVEYANSVLADPLSEQRLKGVLKNKKTWVEKRDARLAEDARLRDLLPRSEGEQGV